MTARRHPAAVQDADAAPVPREAHPAAALFPLYTGEQMEALADDVRESGLREPIVLDPEGPLAVGLRAVQRGSPLLEWLFTPCP